MVHPLNAVISKLLYALLWRAVLCPHPASGISWLISADLGRDRGALASSSNRMADQHDERLSRACVVDKNLAWSELGQQYCLNFGLHSRHRVCSGQPKFKK